MTTAEILRRARDLYAANPSHAAAHETPEIGTVCAIRALSVALGTRPVVITREYDLLCEAAGVDYALAVWNAEHSTAEVLAAFDRAVALAETR